jgi:hypothetical protein
VLGKYSLADAVRHIEDGNGQGPSPSVPV